MIKLNSYAAATICNVCLIGLAVFGIIYTGSLWALLPLFFLANASEG